VAALTNKIYDTFDQITASPNLEASTMQYLKSERLKREQRSAKSKWKLRFAAACAALIFFAYAGSYYMVHTPISYISIDVNPSIELSLNRFDHVISAIAYNEDARQILNSTNVKGMLCTDAVDAIITSDAMQPYFTDDYALTFTVASSNDKKETALLNAIDDCSGFREHRGESCHADINAVSEAHKYNLSFGKYCAILTLSQYDENISIEHCMDMPMSEIQSQIHSHQCCETYDNTESYPSDSYDGHHSCHNHH